MSCAEIRERLPLLAYGELAEPDQKVVQAHLASCAHCREEYAALGRVRELLDASPPGSGRSPAQILLGLDV